MVALAVVPWNVSLGLAVFVSISSLNLTEEWCRLEVSAPLVG